MAVTNPLSGLIEGMLTGHQLGMQLKRAQMEEEAFRTNQVLHDRQSTMQEIMNRQALNEMGRQVVNGTVTSPAIQAKVPGLDPRALLAGGAGPAGAADVSTPEYVRKPDQSRTVGITDRFGKAQFELYSPEEQDQRKMDREIRTKTALMKGEAAAQADIFTEARKQVLLTPGLYGIAPRGLEFMGIQVGDRVPKKELLDAMREVQGFRKADLITNKPGEITSSMDTFGAFGAPQEAQQPQYAPNEFDVFKQAGAVQGPPGPAARWEALTTRRKPAPAGGPAATGAANAAGAGMRVVARGGEPLPTGDFQRVFAPAYAKNLGYKTFEEMPSKLKMEAFSAYKQYDTNPEMMQSILATRAATQAFHQSTLQNAADQRGQHSYQFHIGEVDKLAKPIEDALSRYSRLEDILNEGTPQADALVAPGLITLMVGGQGSGVRMTEPEIMRIVGGRSNWESLKTEANKWRLDPRLANSITPDQRSQVRSLMDVVGRKIKAKQELLDSARQQLSGNNDPMAHRKVTSGLHTDLTKIDTTAPGNTGGGRPPLSSFER